VHACERIWKWDVKGAGIDSRRARFLQSATFILANCTHILDPVREAIAQETSD